MSKPIILVTNDDGLFAPGIKALAEAVLPLGEVFIVAPDSPQSGQGHAITIEQPLRLRKVEFSVEGVTAFECSGTPADCVKLAKDILFKEMKPDLCVSGINHGSNASINIIYSGTMSAAMEASLEGIPSIGFSLLDYGFDADFTAAKQYAYEIAKKYMSKDFGTKLLNVNIPKLTLSEIKGIRVCRQAEARWVEEFLEAKDPRQQPYYWLTGKFINEDTGTDTDINALANGYVSIVPCHHDLTNYKAMEVMKGSFFE